MLKFKLIGQSLIRLDGDKVVGDSKNYLKAKFDFSDDWAEASPILASFCRTDRSEAPYQVEIENGECIVPWEVLIGSGTLIVSVSGGDLITSNSVSITVYKAGPLGVMETAEASPTMYKKLMAAIEALKDFIGELPEDAEAETVVEFVAAAAKAAAEEAVTDSEAVREAVASAVSEALENSVEEITAAEAEAYFD